MHTKAVEGNSEHRVFSLGQSNHFEIHHGERSAKARHGGRNFPGRFRNCEVAELFTQRCSQLVGGIGIVVSENNIDRPHGKPLFEWRRGRQEPTR